MKFHSLQLCGLALAVVAGLNSMALAGQPSQSGLSDMGLANLVVMTDSESLSVRGMGWSPVKVAGWGFAKVNFKGASAGSENSYSASGKHKDWGSNESEAGVEISHGRHTKGITAFSGGSSRAGRK